jgi:DNA-nicking Smr family endonuclease
VPAALRVAEFVRSRRARGLRCLCVVTGYGKNSPDGASVLLDAVVNTLRAAPAAGDVDAFASAPEGLGGRGALLISLRH